MIVDTCFLIDLQRRRPAAQKQLRRLAGATLLVPPIVVVEYLAGLDDQEAQLDALRAAVRFIDFTAEDAAIAARLARRGRIDGTFPGWNDVCIAASAVRHQMPILTRNPRHFPDTDVVTY